LLRNRRNQVLSLALAGVLAFGVACGDDNDIDDISDGLGLVTPTPTAEAEGGGIQPPTGDTDRDNFIANVEDQLNQLEARLTELEVEVNTLPRGDLRDDAKERLDRLQDEMSDIESKLGDVRTASDNEFAQLRNDIENDLEDARNDLDSLIEDIGL
jgi:hypothetical protein